MASVCSSKYALLFTAALCAFCFQWANCNEDEDSYNLLCDGNIGDYHCQCPDDDTDSNVNCSSRLISVLPNDISFPYGVKSVTFKNNKIQAVQSNAFSGTGIDHLDLSRNAIRFLSASAFLEMGNLECLDLSHNAIWSIGTSVFEGLTFLKTLDLSYNSIGDFFGEIFQPCSNLQVLMLKYNPLMFLEENRFRYLPTLQNLDLQSTGLTFLPENVFYNNTGLRRLTLSSNAFQDVPSEALRKLTKLTHLDLSQNPIRTIKARSFDGLQSLKTLMLNNMNKLVQIEDYAMAELFSLEEIFLSHNPQLEKISENAFKTEKMTEESSATKSSLRRLILRHNNLQSLSENLVSWKDLDEVDIRDNRWKCDCHISWMATTNLPGTTKKRLTCSNPSKLQGRKIESIGPMEFTCDYFTPAAIVGLSLLVLGAFSLALSGAAFLMYRNKCCAAMRNRKQYGYARVVTTKERVDLEWDHTAEPSNKDA